MSQQPNNYKQSRESEIFKNVTDSAKEVQISNVRKQVKTFTRGLIITIGEVLTTYLVWNWQLSTLFSKDLTLLQAVSIVVLAKVLFPFRSLAATILESFNSLKQDSINNKK